MKVINIQWCVAYKMDLNRQSSAGTSCNVFRSNIARKSSTPTREPQLVHFCKPYLVSFCFNSTVTIYIDLHRCTLFLIVQFIGIHALKINTDYTEANLNPQSSRPDDYLMCKVLVHSGVRPRTRLQLVFATDVKRTLPELGDICKKTWRFHVRP